MVFGGARGLGYKLSKQLAQQGFNVCIIDDDFQLLELTLKKLQLENKDSPITFKTLKVDFTEFENIQDYKDNILAHLHSLDIGILVFNPSQVPKES